MLCKTLITVVAAGSLFAAAVALVPYSLAPLTAAPKADAGYGSHKPRYIKGKLMDGCFEEPVECGLVVW